MNMAKYNALVVDDDELLRNMLVEFLSRVDIDALAYGTAEELLAYLFPTPLVELEYMPDLIVIDLQLKQDYMQGPDLIYELVSPKYNIPSSLMAISGVIPSAEFVQDLKAFSAATLLPKPFGIPEFCPRAKRLADIGKKRRLKRIQSVNNRLYSMDSDRENRPVFISHASEEEMLANGIRIHIESLGIDVWYGPTTIDVGEVWRDQIKAGVKNASVFVPILSDFYFASSVCIDELSSFLKRLDTENRTDLLFLPIVYKLSSRLKNHEIFRKISEKYHYIDFAHATDGLTRLTMPIQALIARSKNLHRRPGEMA
jgi:CheY-like chemotaxis protein